MQELTVNPAPKRFSMSQEVAFVQELEDLDRHSVMWQMTKPEDIQLNQQAEIGPQKLRLTTLALYQLCQSVCPGLYGFVRELSGVHRRMDESRGDYSFAESIDVINRIVRRRFDSRLHGKVLLRNTKYGTIDGVLTPGYKWLSNLRLYEMTKEAMRQCNPEPVFWEAQIGGRWLLLRFCNTQPYFQFDTPGINIGTMAQIPTTTERFYVGYHFSNDELGRAMVRGAPYILRKNGHTAALASLDLKGRVRHAGAGFEERLTQLLVRTTDPMPSPDDYIASMVGMLNKNLGLGHKLQREESKARQKIAEKLAKKELPVTVTKRIIASLCSNPSIMAPDVTDFRNTDRTVFDLYVAMGREAKNLPIRLRESVEQLAYELLLNKISLN
jgi:hypothetical protein